MTLSIHDQDCVFFYMRQRNTIHRYLFIFGHLCSLANEHLPNKMTKSIDCQFFTKLAQPSLYLP